MVPHILWPFKSVWAGEWGGGVVFVSSMSLWFSLQLIVLGKGNYCNQKHLFSWIFLKFPADFKRFVYDFNGGIFVWVGGEGCICYNIVTMQSLTVNISRNVPNILAFKQIVCIAVLHFFFLSVIYGFFLAFKQVFTVWYFVFNNSPVLNQ